MQKIIPHLWFDTQAKTAAEFYCSIFPDSRMLSTVILKDTPSGDSEIVSFSIGGYDFMAISAGPYFKINPSISFLLNFDSSQDSQAEARLQELWSKLIDGGQVIMPLKAYPFSKQYGWVQDKFGVSWQLMLTDPAGEPRPFIIPTMLFADSNTNKAEEAIQFYLSVFKDTKSGMLARYTEDTGPAKKGSLQFGDFMLAKQWFAAMDSATAQPYTFNEALSLLIVCDSQEEIDYYWNKLSVTPEAEQCGWLKDKYGLSWQVTPRILEEYLQKGTPEQRDRVTQTFLKMKKIIIADLEAAYKG